MNTVDIFHKRYNQRNCCGAVMAEAKQHSQISVLSYVDSVPSSHPLTPMMIHIHTMHMHNTLYIYAHAHSAAVLHKKFASPNKRNTHVHNPKE